MRLAEITSANSAIMNFSGVAKGVFGVEFDAFHKLLSALSNSLVSQTTRQAARLEFADTLDNLENAMATFINIKAYDLSNDPDLENKIDIVTIQLSKIQEPRKTAQI